MKIVCIEIIDENSEMGESRKYSLPFSSVKELNSQIDMLIEKTKFLKVTVYVEPTDFQFDKNEMLELEDCELEVLNF
jgi:hypothetical protein